jgi:hypothetical protein
MWRVVKHLTVGHDAPCETGYIKQAGGLNIHARSE